MHFEFGVFFDVVDFCHGPNICKRAKISKHSLKLLRNSKLDLAPASCYHSLHHGIKVLFKRLAIIHYVIEFIHLFLRLLIPFYGPGTIY